MKKFYKLITPLLLVSTHASASALYFYEVGGEEAGLASAGMAARAQDASVLSVNPAGLAHVQGKSFTGGAQLIYGDVDYTREKTGHTANDTVGAFPSAAGFYSQQINEHWTAGIGLYGNFGSSLDFGDTLNIAGTNSTYVSKATLMALTLAPTIAYRINEQWSVGVGVGMNYGVLSAERNGVSDNYKDDDQDVAFNGKVGVLYEFDEDTRIGFGYTSETQYDYDLSGLSAVGNGASAKIKTPQQAMLSVYHNATADWALMGNVGWQNWSRYADSEVRLPNTGNLIDGSRMIDTYHVAVGSQYKINSNWKWNMGVAFDSSAFNDRSNTSITVPAGNEMRIGTGVEYAIDSSQSVGVAVEYLHSDDTEVQTPPIKGNYESNYYFVTMHYSWKSI